MKIIFLIVWPFESSSSGDLELNLIKSRLMKIIMHFSYLQVANYSHSTRLLAATTLRNVLGTRNLSELLTEREAISHTMQTSLDVATVPWGVQVERVEMFVSRIWNAYSLIVPDKNEYGNLSK